LANPQFQTGSTLATESQPPEFLTVGIGASAGGIKALKEFFAAMPADSGMAFAVILHLAPEHESLLPAVLQTNTAMPVRQVTETVKVEPNHVYVIPPNQQLALVEGEIRLVEPEPLSHKRAPIDLFFRTLAATHGRNSVCVILSGTGSDGTLGLKHVKEAGGLVLVQEPTEAEFDGMPNSAIATKLADWVLPVREMPAKISAFKQSLEKTKLPTDEEALPAPELGADALPAVLVLLKARTKHDFSNYKQPTLLRRIARRLQVHGCENISEYLELLRAQPDEAQTLLKNLLISVTNFFRDKEAFAALEREVVPQLFAGKTALDQVRVWCVGCATGEEAYSIAILLSEYAAQLADPPKIQVFASDIDTDAIAVAREGRYDESIALDVTPERLRCFFTHEGATYRVQKELRELVLFAPHNILHDPPFSQQDLVTCRNLLIYLNHQTQEKVIETFHFAVWHDGYLFLGASEMAETVPALFGTVDQKARIYQSRPATKKTLGLAARVTQNNWQTNVYVPVRTSREQSDSFPELHLKLVEQFSPPSILINEHYDILHLSESAGRYLRFRGGEPTHNLGKVAHPALRPDLLAALFAAKQAKGRTESRHLRVTLDGETRFVNLTVHPLQTPEAARGYFLIIFEEVTDSSIPPEMLQKIMPADEGAEIVIRRLEEDLQHTRDRLRQTVEQHEVSVEELKASNEELQAINVELRSTGEELETSKEELQSVNEELTTVNADLKEKVDEVSRANLDLQNLLVATEVSTIFLDRDLNIKRFTPAVRRLFNLIPSDVGRPFAHLTHRLKYDNLALDAADVLSTLQSCEREVQSLDECWYLVCLIPYRTGPAQIEGILLTFRDITESKLVQAQIFSSQEQLRQLATHLQTVREEERSSIAREVHDELGQLLAAVMMNLKWVGGSLPLDDQKARARLTDTRELITKMSQSVRHITTSLHPTILDDFGLPAALEWLLKEFQKHSGIACRSEGFSETLDLDHDCALALFRICQESLTNIARHAQATEVMVRLQVSQTTLWLHIQDNGRGIAPIDLAHLHSFGLISIRERVLSFGGEFTIQGLPGQGTSVDVRIPLVNGAHTLAG
jgi:two-component system, chemotaxis family, CheB/CheR fusion protein